MYRIFAIISAVASFMIAAPASASVTISFAGGNSSTDGPNGNIASYANNSLRVQASAWMFNGSSVQTAFLGQYSNGLGVTNASEGNGSLPSANAIDNVNGYDLVLLFFNQPVSLVSAILSPVQVGSGQPDNDATVAFATLAGAFTTNPTPITASNPVWTGFATTAYSVAGNNASPFSTPIPGNSAYTNAWLVSADILGLDRSPDGFRLNSVTVNVPAVPEPSTWLMSLLGFCAIGSAVRRNRSPIGRRLAQIA